MSFKGFLYINFWFFINHVWVNFTLNSSENQLDLSENECLLQTQWKPSFASVCLRYKPNQCEEMSCDSVRGKRRTSCERACTSLFMFHAFCRTSGQQFSQSVHRQVEHLRPFVGGEKLKISALDAYIYTNYWKYHCSYVYLTTTTSLLNYIHVARRKPPLLSFGKLTHLDAKRNS